MPELSLNQYHTLLPFWCYYKNAAADSL